VKPISGCDANRRNENGRKRKCENLNTDRFHDAGPFAVIRADGGTIPPST
jgi:hypothetical protein